MSFGKRTSSGYGGVERRRAKRAETDIAAEILVPSAQPRRCRITELTEVDARLVVSPTFGIPDAFELRYAGATRRVTTVRRGKGFLAVRFLKRSS